MSPASVTPGGSPFLRNDNTGSPSDQPVTSAQITNPYRAKSCQVVGLDSTINPADTGYLLTWEVTMLASYPMIIGSFVVMAGLLPAQLSNYINPWLYGIDPPNGFNFADPTQDFTLQVCISDGWDLENRKKLRQESLTYQMRSDAFKFSPAGLPAAGSDPTVPSMPLNGGRNSISWDGFAVMADALVLVPVGARVVFQWTIPWYGDANRSTWGLHPERGNTWNLRALTYSPTH